MKKRLAAIFIDADGCSLRFDSLLGQPLRRRIMLPTGLQLKEGIARFRLRRVHRSSGEAWCEEVGHVLNRQRAG